MDAHRDALVGLYQNIARVILGKKQPILHALSTLLCQGHLLIEDVPGVGKTMLARALATSLQLRFRRIQCTPDLLPADVTGVSVFNDKTREFEFLPGPVFTNILLADEINRATPRTQSALLECMAEGQVTVEGETHRLARPFMVIATQNPVEFHGTYPLPEAQLDRFFMRIDMGYPSLDEEIQVMRMQIAAHPIDSLSAVMAPDALAGLQQAVPEISIHDDVHRYIASLVAATREHAAIELGASPRGSIALMKASQAAALISGRDYVDPATVKSLVLPVLGHRLVLKSEAQLSGSSPSQVLREIMGRFPVPVTSQ